MTKKIFNRFDPFMPLSIEKSSINPSVEENGSEGLFEDFNKSTLSESLKFASPQVKKGFVVIVTKLAIGKENELGEKLLESFISSISDSFELPQYLIFMNEAVFLLNNEKIESSLSQMKKYGVKNLISLESLEYFKYKVTSNSIIQATSGDISEKILFSKKLIIM